MLKKSIVLLGVLLATVLSGCCVAQDNGGNGKGVNGPMVVKIGGLFDLSGDTKDIGVPFSQGAEAYIDFYNHKGSSIRVEMESLDYARQDEEDSQVYEQLMAMGGVEAVLVDENIDSAVHSLLSRGKIPVIAGGYTGSLAELEDSPYSFVVTASYVEQLRVTLKWIKEDYGFKGTPRVACVSNDSFFRGLNLNDIRQAAEDAGCEVIKDEWLIDFSVITRQLLEFQDAMVDYAVVYCPPQLTAAILKEAKELRLNTQFIGLGPSADKGVLELAGSAGEGFIGAIPFAFPNEDVAGRREIESYLRAKGQSLNGINHAFIQGWVSSKVLVEALNRTGGHPTAEEIYAALQSLTAFDTGGLSDAVTFNAERRIGSDRVRLAEADHGSFSYVSGWIGDSKLEAPSGQE